MTVSASLSMIATASGAPLWTMESALDVDVGHAIRHVQSGAAQHEVGIRRQTRCRIREIEACIFGAVGAVHEHHGQGQRHRIGRAIVDLDVFGRVQADLVVIDFVDDEFV